MHNFTLHPLDDRVKLNRHHALFFAILNLFLKLGSFALPLKEYMGRMYSFPVPFLLSFPLFILNAGCLNSFPACNHGGVVLEKNTAFSHFVKSEEP